MKPVIIQNGNNVDLSMKIPNPKGRPLDDLIITVAYQCGQCQTIYNAEVGIGGGEIEKDCSCGKHIEFSVNPIHRI